MPGLGDEVEVRRGVSWVCLGGGSGSAGVLLVWAWAAMVHGFRGRLEGWRSLGCGCWRFRFLEVWAERRRLAVFRVRDLRPGRQESLRPLRCLSLDQLLLGAVEGGVVGREEGRKGQGGRAWEQAVGGG